MKKLYILILCLCWTTVAGAAPSINQPGDAVVGVTLTISGSDFGTKATAAPKRFDKFEEGVSGQDLSDHNAVWSEYSPGASNKYTDLVSHSGALSVGNVIPNGEWFGTNYYTFTPSVTEVYITYWWRTVNADTGDNTVIKLPRINSSEAAGGGGVYTGTGNMTLGGTYNLANSDGPYCAYNNGATNEIFFNPSGTAPLDFPPNNTWMRVEMYKKLSTAGVADGKAEVRIFGVDSAVENSALTRASGQTFALDTVYMGLSDGSEGTHSYSMYLDDMYIDTTQARVEICEESTWAARTHCEIQPPSSWSSDSITITVNAGSLAVPGTAYLYVVDSDGVANSSGVQVSLENSVPVVIGGSVVGGAIVH